jgi:hypothetical protein
MVSTAKSPFSAVPAQASPNLELSDLSLREIVVFAPLIAWAFFWIAINPQPYFHILDRPVAQIVERERPGYYAEERHLLNPLLAQNPWPPIGFKISYRFHGDRTSLVRQMNADAPSPTKNCL